MAHLIDKDALVAEIDNMLNIKEHTSHSDETAFNSGRWKALKKVKDIIDTLEVKEVQEEPVRCDFEMALAEMIDKAQKCVVEPWVVAAQWKDELVKLAKECKAMQEHPKDCMYSKDNYTDEDRKILCEGCEEECRFNKED